MGRISERILFYRLKQKDKEAFSAFYDLNIDKIYKFVYFKIGSHEEAEDLTSAIFLKTWNYLQENSREDSSGSLRALLYKIARTTIIDHYRKKSLENKGQVSLENNGAPLAIPDEKENLEKRMQFFSDLNFVSKKMLELKEDYRELIILRYIQELTIGEIAEIYSKSHGNIRVQVFRALKALKDLVKEGK
jgi:RNA polymerase sigma factor (sigma-70 family)